MAGINPNEMREGAQDLKEALQSGGLPVMDPTNDDFDAEGSVFQQYGDRLNVPLDSIFGDSQDMSVVEATLKGEEGALLLPSDAPPQHLPPRWDGNPANEARENQVRFAAQIDATFRNPRTRTKIDPMTDAHMRNILKQAQELPAPDVVTFVKNRKIVIDGDVISTPNRLDRRKSLAQLKNFLQGQNDCQKDRRNADGTVAWCKCPVHRVARSAQQWGFRDKPLVWLSQHIAVLLADRNIWRDLPADGTYDERIDEDFTSAHSLPRALAQLISAANVENLVTCMRGKCSLISAFRHLTQMVCDNSDKLKTPTDYTYEFDV